MNLASMQYELEIAANKYTCVGEYGSQFQTTWELFLNYKPGNYFKEPCS